MFCSKCGAEIGKEAKFCSKCGTAVNSVCFCPECGRKTSLDAIFCPFCGYKIKKNEKDVLQEKNYLRNKKIKLLQSIFQIITSFSVAESTAVLIRKNDAFEKQKNALLWIEDIDKIIIPEDISDFDWQEFLNQNYVKCRNVIILEKKADMIGNGLIQRVLRCYVGNTLVEYEFLVDGNKRVNINRTTKSMIVYEFNDGKRCIADGKDILDGDGNFIGKIQNGGDKFELDSLSKTESFPAPFILINSDVFNLITGKVVLQGYKDNGFFVRTFKDKYTYKKILEIRMGEPFGNCEYNHYEIKYDKLDIIEELDDLESLSSQPDRYEEYNDPLSEYRKQEDTFGGL